MSDFIPESNPNAPNSVTLLDIVQTHNSVTNRQFPTRWSNIKTLLGAGVSSVAGTPDRITVAPTTGDVVVNISEFYAGQTSIITLGTVSTGVWNATAVAPTFGGTGLTTYTTGDLIYASAANVLSKRAIGSAGQILTVSGGIPIWTTDTGTGTVTSVSVVTNQGVSGSVTNPTTAASVTLSLGALTGITSFNGLVVTANTGVITTGTWNGTAIADGNLATSYLKADGSRPLTGNWTVGAFNFVSDTTTGIKIGTAINQKLGFWNATPIIQPSGDVVTALQNLGLGASLTLGVITGTATNDDATSGKVGEYVSSSIAAGSAVSLTTTTTTNVTSISLTAGDWDVRILGYFKASGASASDFQLGLSVTSATMDTTAGRFNNNPTVVTGLSGDLSSVVPNYRLSLSGTTTVYFTAQSTFTLGTVSCYGIISARRVR